MFSFSSRTPMLRSASRSRSKLPTTLDEIRSGQAGNEAFALAVGNAKAGSETRRTYPFMDLCEGEFILMAVLVVSSCQESYISVL